MFRPKKKGDVFFPARKAQDVRREEVAGRACRQQGCLHKDDGSCVVAGAKIFSRPKRKKSEDMMDLA
jgi:hypothetical protein